MIQFQVETKIAAPIRRCFDLSRSVEAHVASTQKTGEQVVAGKRQGLLEVGEEVTWEARHFGIRQRLSSRITKMDRPWFFQDAMIQGAFRSFEHDHHFHEAAEGETFMVDVVRFEAP